MAPASGRNRPALIEQLRGQAYRFDFFQAVRILERLAWDQSEGDAGLRRYPVGEDRPPRQEIVRFRALPSHAFPAGAISAFHAPGKTALETSESAPPELLVAFLGLTGPQGALPRHYTALLIERLRLKDYALRDFLDLFNHRVISLFYRAWEKYRFAFAYERSVRAVPSAEEDLFTYCLYCLTGLGTGGLRARMSFDDETCLYYAGHFAHHPRSAVALERILADYFALPVKIKQFQGQWLYLSMEDQSSLPSPLRPEGLNNALGKNAVAGERVWDVEGKLRVRLGPLGYDVFCRFLPSGDALRSLCQMVRFYVGPQFDFDVQLVLKAPEAPWCRLGDGGQSPSRLGWNTWIRCGEFERDVSDAVFSLDE
jgi:type VI secretion system protein ImpH